LETSLGELTAQIVAAFVEHNRISVSDLARFIGDVHHTISTVGTELQQPVGPAKATSAQIRKSITADGLISFEDGRRYKSMRRHLSRFGLTPDEYRAKWGLPKDYPIVSPGYSAERSALAKSMGLGKKPSGAKRPSKPSPGTRARAASSKSA
jgi:predicted transcriptional regulator